MVKTHVSPPAVASALESVASDDRASPDARADAVALLIGDAERSGRIASYFNRVRRAARGAAKRLLESVRPIRSNPRKASEDFPTWTPPIIPGAPELKLVRISAGRKTRPIVTASQIAQVFGFLAYQHNEEFWLALMDSQLRIAGRVLMTRGTVGASPVFVSEIMRVVLHSGMHRFVVAHCHPAGGVTPSPDDIEITKRIREACRLLGDIHLMDHVIIGDQSSHSKGAYDYIPTGRRVLATKPDAADTAQGVADRMAEVAGQEVFYTSFAESGLMRS